MEKGTQSSVLVLSVFLLLIVFITYRLNNQDKIISMISDNPNVLVVYAKDTGNISDVTSFIVKTFSQSGDSAVRWALRCAESESGLDPSKEHWNYNNSWDTGVFQINSVHGYSRDYLLDFKNNIRTAYSLWKEQGKSIWYGRNCY